MKVGLTLGKYAPLHKGHELVIETALAEMDHVMVVIYDCPETTRCPLNVRAGWIRRLFPSVEVIEAWDGPTVNGDTPEIKALHEAYILNILKGRKVTHFYSSEFYGDHMSRALGAVNRQVDSSRTIRPVSGTDARSEPFRWREHISQCVYRDLIANIVFVGAPSTGKSTLAERLARKYETVWMPEYGREYWEKHQVDRRLSLEQLTELAKEHLEREDRLLGESRKFLFTDTNAMTTYIFSQYYHGQATEELTRMAQAASSRYDLFFLCDTDIPYDDTWDRSGDGNRQVFQKMILADLVTRKVPFISLSGSIEQRMLVVGKVLRRYEKYAPLRLDGMG